MSRARKRLLETKEMKRVVELYYSPCGPTAPPAPALIGLRGCISCLGMALLDAAGPKPTLPVGKHHSMDAPLPILPQDLEMCLGAPGSPSPSGWRAAAATACPELFFQGCSWSIRLKCCLHSGCLRNPGIPACIYSNACHPNRRANCCE